MILIPQIKSAIKRVRTTAIANKRDVAESSKLRTAARKLGGAAENDAKDILGLEVKAVRTLDKAALKGLILRNKISCNKPCLSRKAANE